MKNLKKTVFTLNLVAIYIAYLTFLGVLAKDVNQAYNNQQSCVSALPLGLSCPYGRQDRENVGVVSNSNVNESMLGVITDNEKVNKAFSLMDEMDISSNKMVEDKQAIMEIYSKYKGSGSNNFTDSISQLILEYQDFLNSLTLVQLLTILNILIGFLILNCLFTLIAVFYGESLINYFNLDQKFPRLTKFIMLRKKFNQFYFFVNCIVIIIAIISMIYANYLMFNFFN